MTSRSDRELLADGMLTVPEAIAFSRLRKTTLFGLMASGRLASVLVGRRRLIPKRALVDFLAAGLAR